MNQYFSNLNFSNIFKWVLAITVLLMPVFFVPSTTFPLYSAKISILATLVVILCVLFLAKTLSSGVISIPKTKMLIPIALFPIIAFLSSIFSGNTMTSLVGDVFDVGTSGSFIILTLLFFLVLFSMRDNYFSVKTIIKYFIFSGFIVVVHTIVRVLSFSIIPESVSMRIPNFITGGAIDTTIILGASIICMLCALNMTSVVGKFKYLIYAGIVLSTMIIGAINFLPVMLVLCLFSLIYFVFMFSNVFGGEGGLLDIKKYIPTLFVLIFSVVIIISGSTLSGHLSNLFKINTFEVRPNFHTTLEIVKESIKINPVLGVGPNRFDDMWNMHKPNEVNLTDFWNANFKFGSNTIMTLLSTTGILGFLSIVLFMVMYVAIGFKSLFVKSDNQELDYITTTTFFTSLFLWVMTIAYVPGIVSLSLTFIFSALFISIISSRGILPSMDFNLFANQRANFVVVFGIVLSLILSIAGGYFVWQRNISANIFQSGIMTLSAGDIESAKLKMASAIEISETDSYWRNLTELTLIELSQVLSTITNAQNLSETKRAEIQVVISNSIEAARRAISLNSDNYQNWFMLGRVYESLASVGIQGALENAENAYLDAEKRAPNNPSIPLAFARLQMIRGDLDTAKTYIEKALGLKNNYTDAYFTFAQIEVANNNIPNAIRSVESATLTDPNNHNLYFQLGILKYNNDDFSGAVEAFERVVYFVPDYANARYFLGLSYDKINRDEDAIAQFKEIQKTNPDNEEVSFILNNLESGLDPFYTARPPVDDEPENRKELPI